MNDRSRTTERGPRSLFRKGTATGLDFPYTYHDETAISRDFA